MPKQTISVTVDFGLPNKVKAQGLNISEVCNNALRAVLVETHIKEQTEDAQADNFKKECGYAPYYDTDFNEDSLILLKNSKFVQKSLLHKYPDLNIEGLLKYLAKKYEK